MSGASILFVALLASIATLAIAGGPAGIARALPPRGWTRMRTRMRYGSDTIAAHETLAALDAIPTSHLMLIRAAALIGLAGMIGLLFI